MAQNSINRLPYEDEVDLNEIMNLLIKSKKLIILSILFFTTLAIIFSALAHKNSYYSSTTIEIGYSDLFGNKVLIEKPEDLIEELLINFFQKKQTKGLESEDVEFKVLYKKLILVNLTSHSAELNENFLTNLINFSFNRHDAKSSYEHSKSIDQISQNIQQVDLELKLIDEEIKEIEGLKKFNEINKIALIQSISSLLINKSHLSLKLMELEKKLEMLNTKKIYKTQSINGIETKQIKPNRITTILLGSAFGLLVSLLLIFFRNLMSTFKQE